MIRTTSSPTRLYDIGVRVQIASRAEKPMRGVRHCVPRLAAGAMRSQRPNLLVTMESDSLLPPVAILEYTVQTVCTRLLPETPLLTRFEQAKGS